MVSVDRYDNYLSKKVSLGTQIFIFCQIWQFKKQYYRKVNKFWLVSYEIEQAPTYEKSHSNAIGKIFTSQHNKNSNARRHLRYIRTEDVKSGQDLNYLCCCMFYTFNVHLLQHLKPSFDEAGRKITLAKFQHDEDLPFGDSGCHSFCFLRYLFSTILSYMRVILLVNVPWHV